MSWPVGGSPELVEPKTGSSARRISLDAQTIESLRRLRAGQRWGDLGLVIATRAGVVRIRFHDLRHRHATLLLRQGRTIKEVADRLGHANAATLLRRYAHVLPDQRAETARVIGDVLGGCDHL